MAYQRGQMRAANGEEPIFLEIAAATASPTAILALPAAGAPRRALDGITLESVVLGGLVVAAEGVTEIRVQTLPPAGGTARVLVPRLFLLANTTLQLQDLREEVPPGHGVEVVHTAGVRKTVWPTFYEKSGKGTA